MKPAQIRKYIKMIEEGDSVQALLLTFVLWYDEDNIEQGLKSISEFYQHLLRQLPEPKKGKVTQIDLEDAIETEKKEGRYGK